MMPLNVFIGYDPRQPVAFQVAAHSAWSKTKAPCMSLHRLTLANLPLTRRGLTEFTYSRFLAPYLCGFQGISLFLDSDVLVRADLAELLAYPMMEPATPVFVVQGPRRFEWASVMVFNNALCTILTPEYLQNPQLNPLKFEWAQTVGTLPADWNHLVGYDAPMANAKIVHFTAGIPIWEETKHCEYAEEWRKTAKHSMSSVSFEALMGQSVHKVAMQTGAMQLKAVS